MDVGVRDNSGKFTESFEIFAKLPAGTLTSVIVQFETTVKELKSIIEFTSGIPSNLQQLSYKSHYDLEDRDTLRSLCIIPGVQIPVSFIHGYEDLVESALAGNTKGVLGDLKKRFDDANIQTRRHAALFVASQRGYHFLVERLVKDGADVNRQLSTGRTPLHIACATGNTGCIDFLLEAGASLDIKDSYGQTPVEIAANCKQRKAERLLRAFRRTIGGPTVYKRKADPPRERIVSTWAWTPRFRARSAPPASLLREMSLTPGPELMISQCKLEEPASGNKSVTFDEGSVVSEVETLDFIQDDKSYESGESCKENVIVPKSARGRGVAYGELLRRKHKIERTKISSDRGRRAGYTNKKCGALSDGKEKSETLEPPDRDEVSERDTVISDETYESWRREKAEHRRIADTVLPPEPNVLRVGGMEIPRADPQDNQKAVRDWLRSKNAAQTHSNMYEQWQRRRVEELERQRRRMIEQGGKSREQWEAELQKKRSREKERAKRQLLEEEKQRQENARERFMNGYTFEGWYELKKKESQAKGQTGDDTRSRRQIRQEKQLMAQKSFEKWMLDKQWEELCRLKAKPSDRPKTATGLHLPSRKLH